MTIIKKCFSSSSVLLQLTFVPLALAGIFSIISDATNGVVLKSEHRRKWNTIVSL